MIIIVGNLNTRRFCQYGHQIAEEKLGRHRRMWRDLIGLNLSRQCYTTATLLVVLIYCSLFLRFLEL